MADPPPVSLDGEVVLQVPARAEYARLARLAATGLATRAGFSYDEIEDIRIAVGEACALLVDDEDPSGAVLTLTYRIEGDALHLRAESSASTGRISRPPAMSIRILEALVHDLRFEPQALAFTKPRAVP